MKKLLPILACLALLSAMAFASGATMTGYIVDEKCGARGANASAAACSKKCIEAGEKPVFVSDNSKEVLHLDNPDATKGHEGHHVNVTGSVKGGVLHIDKLAMASSEHQH
ncbi:MAG: hypothetical protein LAN64_13515 [Acidobacteriia bacterium]|nr:hypothetical protein [Terriglobia bacterium]